MSLQDSALEEERRLCYVGITRAMEKLYICWAEKRRLFGTEHYHSPSRFIDEIPSNLVQEIRLNAQVSRPYIQASISRDTHSDFEIGQRLMHPKFGEGTVLAFEGSGDNIRVHVNFLNAGAKWLVLAYANLQAR